MCGQGECKPWDKVRAARPCALHCLAARPLIACPFRLVAGGAGGAGRAHVPLRGHRLRDGLRQASALPALLSSAKARVTTFIDHPRPCRSEPSEPRTMPHGTRAPVYAWSAATRPSSSNRLFSLVSPSQITALNSLVRMPARRVCVPQNTTRPCRTPGIGFVSR